MERREDEHSPRPWQWLPDEGQFIVDVNGDIVAEVPCQGCNPKDGELIVRAVNQHTALVEQRDLLVAALREVRAKFFEHAQAGANVVKGNLVPLDNGQHPWIPGVEAPSTIQVIDNVLATVRRGEGRELQE